MGVTQAPRPRLLSPACGVWCVFLWCVGGGSCPLGPPGKFWNILPPGLMPSGEPGGSPGDPRFRPGKTGTGLDRSRDARYRSRGSRGRSRSLWVTRYPAPPDRKHDHRPETRRDHSDFCLRQPRPHTIEHRCKAQDPPRPSLFFNYLRSIMLHKLIRTPQPLDIFGNLICQGKRLLPSFPGLVPTPPTS